MNNSGLNRIVFSGAVVEFVAVAGEFCQVVENPARYKTHDLVDLTRKLLPLLYFKASMLPEVTPAGDDEPEKVVTELDYNVLHQKWVQILGEYDSFYEVFDPELQFGSETVTSGISENILDIYQQVKDFVVSYSLGNEEVMNDSLAGCIQNFNNFWGQRLVNVLRALHQLAMSDVQWDENVSPAPGETPSRPAGWVEHFFNRNNE